MDRESVTVSIWAHRLPLALALTLTLIPTGIEILNYFPVRLGEGKE